MHGLTIGRNLFGTTYYTLVGFHGLHVTVGVIAMLVVLALVIGRRVNPANGPECNWSRGIGISWTRSGSWSLPSFTWSGVRLARTIVVSNRTAIRCPATAIRRRIRRDAATDRRAARGRLGMTLLLAGLAIGPALSLSAQ